MDEKVLEYVGLTKNEIKIYLTLLEMGSGLVGVISRRSGIHRRSVYDILDRLIEKGLVSYISSNKRRSYQVTSPERLRSIINKRQEELNNNIPELLLKYDLVKDKQETHFFRGVRAIKSLLDDQLEEGKTVYILGAPINSPNDFTHFFQRFDKQRIKQKIKCYFIFRHSEKQDIKIPLSQHKFLPKDKIQTHYGPASTITYADKVVHFIWHPKNPVAIFIRQKDLAQSFKQYFDIIWDSIWYAAFQA